MEAKVLGSILAVISLLVTIVGAINTVLLLFFRSEIRHLREWIDRNKEDLSKCQSACKEHREYFDQKVRSKD
jgi:cell division protein FtsL